MIGKNALKGDIIASRKKEREEERDKKKTRKHQFRADNTIMY